MGYRKYIYTLLREIISISDESISLLGNLGIIGHKSVII